MVRSLIARVPSVDAVTSVGDNRWWIAIISILSDMGIVAQKRRLDDTRHELKARTWTELRAGDKADRERTDNACLAPSGTA